MRLENQYEPPFHQTNTMTNLVIEIADYAGQIGSHENLSKHPELRRENRIRTIKAGDTVIISDKEWNSYPKALFETIAAKPFIFAAWPASAPASGSALIPINRSSVSNKRRSPELPSQLSV